MPRSLVKHVGFASRRQDFGPADAAIPRKTRRIRVAAARSRNCRCRDPLKTHRIRIATACAER
eukprot:875763-Pyramimonas_sp.AAC.1